MFCSVQAGDTVIVCDAGGGKVVSNVLVLDVGTAG